LRTEPVIDKTALVETVRREYGLHIERLTFVPVGWVAHCYIADCATWQLCSKRILPHIACPIRTRDRQFTVRFENHLLILFDFIEGKTVGFDGLSDDILVKLARLIGILHKSTSQIKVEHPFYERFDIVFENDLVNGLDVLAGITSGDRNGKQELWNLLLPRKDEILGYLNRLKELQTLAKGTGKEMVVCHTDLHGENLMMDDQENLYILDWEGAMIAPPEHDLFFFAWDDHFWNLFLPNYEREFGPLSLDSNVFGFYYYRRNLEDLTAWIVRILYHNTDEEQDQADLRWVVEDCISGWPYLETTIRGIETKLAQRSG
jgi:hypothetical protein